MDYYINQILAVILTSVLIYIISELYEYHQRYKFFKKQYFDNKNTDTKSNFRELLDKQMKEAQNQREEMLNKKNTIVCTANKCMHCEAEIKKNEGILLCANCGL